MRFDGVVLFARLAGAVRYASLVIYDFIRAFYETARTNNMCFVYAVQGRHT